MSYFRPNIERMEGYVPGFQPKEPGYIKLNTNENPYPPSPRVMEVLRNAGPESLRKYPDPMAEKFRLGAAEVLGTRPERILCGNGSDDLLNIAIRSFCGQGDLLAFPSPTYSLYDALARIQGARVRAVQFPQDYSLPDELAHTGARLTLLCNPNAPSGTAVPPEQVRRLASRVSGVLLVDEAYADFADANCLGLVDEFDNVIITRSLSKSYSLAGMRFGFAVAAEPLIEGMAKVKDSYNVDALTVEAATAAIRDQEWFRRNVERVRATRLRLTEGLSRLGFLCWPSQTNFVLARVPAGRDARQIYQQLFERRILVRYFDAPRLDDCLRISVGTDEQVEVLLNTLTEILNAGLESSRPTSATEKTE